MNNNGSTPEVDWIEIRDGRGRLLFKYNPVRNEIEIKESSSDVYALIRLDEIRLKRGYTPEDLSMIFVREYIAVERVSTVSKTPFSKNGK